MSMLNIKVELTDSSVRNTIRRLNGLPDAIGRKALREATFKTGAKLAKQAKMAAPRGRTGTFHRSIRKKDLRFASNYTYVSVIGANKKRRSTVKQTAGLIRRSGFLSRGISGQGKTVPLHFIERGTSPHVIKNKSGSGAKAIYWNIVRPDAKVPTRRAATVRHPGARARPFLEKTERRNRASNKTFFRRYIDRAVLRYARRGSISA